MPKQGFTSISVPERLYDALLEKFIKQQKEHTLNPGVSSLSLFFVEEIRKQIDQDLAMPAFISKIKYVPAKFTENKLQIKHS